MQACHAAFEAAQAAVREGEAPEQTCSMVLLGVDTEEELRTAFVQLVQNGIRMVPFFEPDIGNELTSVCSLPIYGKERKKFQSFKLLE